MTRNLVLHGLWITRLALRGVEAALAAAAEHPHIDEPLPTQPGYSLADVDAALDKLWSETGRRPSLIAITIRPRTDAKLDIYIADGANHEPLLNSSQGYEHHRDAIAVVERIFVADDNALTLAEIRELLADTPSAISPEHENLVTELNAILNTGRPAEPVTLTVHWRNGTTETRRIR